LRPPPTVSVVVTTYRRPSRLTDVLAPLLADGAALEVVVVVDGGDRELLRTLEGLGDPRLRAVDPGGRVGQARARSAGVHASRGEVVLSLDDDVVPTPGLVTGHQRHHHEIPHALVLGYMPVPLQRPQRRGQFATYEYARAYEAQCLRYDEDPGRTLTEMWAGNFSLRRSDYLEAVTGYDFPVAYHDDRDLGLRLHTLGLVGVFDRELKAEHRHERSFDEYLRDAAAMGAAERKLMELHPDAIPPRAPDEVIAGFSLPSRQVIRFSDRRRFRALSLLALRAAVHATGAVRAFDLESRLASLARYIVKRQAARSS
jgi:GT2 family glycosyltransferase